MIQVFNLTSGRTVEYDLDPEQAVRAAHAQFDRKDYNTWSYRNRYPCTEGRYTVACGDWAALRT